MWTLKKMDEESVSARFTFEESFEEKADQHNPTPRWSLDYLRVCKNLLSIYKE